MTVVTFATPFPVGLYDELNYGGLNLISFISFTFLGLFAGLIAGDCKTYPAPFSRGRAAR